MDPFTAALTTAFLAGLCRSVPGLVSDWLKTRNAIRVEYTRARITESTEEARHRRGVEAQEYKATIASYPLGVPGKLRTLFPMSGQRPLILVSPLPPGVWPSLNAIPERVQALFNEVDKIGSYAQAISGAFVCDAGTHRFIDGEVTARAIAKHEFIREPAILVYFEQSPRTLTACAYLSTLFGSVGGESSFSFVIARYINDPGSSIPAVTSLGGDLPAWRYINLDKLPPQVDASDIVAQTITWFLLAAIDAYWALRAGSDPGLLISAGAVPPSKDHVKSASVTPNYTENDPALQSLINDPDLRDRLEREARQLAEAGFQVSAEEVSKGYVGLHVRGVGKDVVFVVGGDYPSAPPVAIREGETPIEIDAQDWSSECTLMDIVEAVP
jgi:hypothetical protein